MKVACVVSRQIVAAVIASHPRSGRPGIKDSSIPNVLFAKRHAFMTRSISFLTPGVRWVDSFREP